MLFIVHKYLDIKAGNIPHVQLQSSLVESCSGIHDYAQDIIHLILCLSEVIANDPEVSPYLQVVMVENYNVTAASFLIAAGDISEQISLFLKKLQVLVT